MHVLPSEHKNTFTAKTHTNTSQSRSSQTHTNLVTLFLLVILIFSCFSVSITSLKPFKTKGESKWPQSVSFHYVPLCVLTCSQWNTLRTRNLCSTSCLHVCTWKLCMWESNIYLCAQNALVLFIYTHNNRKTLQACLKYQAQKSIFVTIQKNVCQDLTEWKT